MAIFGMVSSIVETHIDSLRDRAERIPKVRNGLLSTAIRLAELITSGGAWYAETFEERDAKRREYIRRWDWQPGDVMIFDAYGNPVRPFRGRGNSPIERKAWTFAALRWAWHLIESDPLKWGRDRIEFSARAVPGIKQGARLTKEQVAETRERFGDDQFAFRVQVLHSFRQTATPAGMFAFADWSDRLLDLRLPSVTSEPVDRLDVEDDREATSAHDIFTSSGGRSRWHHLSIDGEPAGPPVVTWVETEDGIDDEFDRGGYRRREDLYAPITSAQGAAAKAAEIARVQEVMERSKRIRSRGETPEEQAENARLRAERHRYLANLSKGAPVRDEASASTPRPIITPEGKVWALRNGKMRLVHRTEEAERSQVLLERIRERRRQPYSPPEYPGFEIKRVGRLAGENTSVFNDDIIEEEVVTEREARASAKAEERKAKNAMEQSRADFDRIALLAADTAEVIDNQAADVPQSDLELLEETLAYFLTGDDPDDDLDLDKAMSEIPGLADAVVSRRERRSSKAPKGLVGAIAQERAKKSDRLHATLFLRGLADLEAAAAGLEDDDEDKED